MSTGSDNVPEQDMSEQGAPAERHQEKRIGFAALSALIPGAGQVAAGYRWRGGAMIAVSLIILAVAFYFYQQGLSTILSYLVQPRYLIALFVINIVVLLFRLGAVLDAFWTSRPRTPVETAGWKQAFVGTVLVLLLVVTAAPHALLGYYTYLSHELITDVFSVENLSVEPVPTSTPAPDPTAIPEPTVTPEADSEPDGITDDLPTPEPTSTPLPEQTPTPAPTPEPTPTPEPDFTGTDWHERGRLTVLLVGSDAGPDRWGARADVLMVASLNLETGQSALFSIPRNFGDVPLSEPVAGQLGTTHFPEMISSLYGHAQNYPGLAPEGGDPGLYALEGTAEALLGIPIDYHAKVDMAGFVELIDAFGGVTVNIEERIYIRMSPGDGGEWRVYDIPAGEQRLSGEEALVYARTRTGSSDYHRMHRQRCLVASLTGQSDVPTLLQIFPDLVDVIREHVTTNVPLDELPELVVLRDHVRIDQVISVGFVPPMFSAGESSKGYNLPAIQAIQESVQRALEHPEQYLDEQTGTELAVGEPC